MAALTPRNPTGRAPGMPNNSVKAHYPQDSPEERAVEPFGGIVSARVSDLARELDTTPEELLDAIDRTGMEPLVDTAQDKGGRGEKRGRPTDPDLRSLALTTEAVRRVEEELEG